MDARLRTKTRTRRAVGGIATTVGLTLTFAAAAVGGLMLHADLPPGRRITAVEVTRVLGSLFDGRIVLDSVGDYGLLGASDIRVHVDGPQNERVITLHIARARIATMALLRSLFHSNSDIEVAISSVDVEDGDVEVGADDAGVLALQRAFTLKTLLPIVPGAPSSKARGVHLSLSNVTFAHLSVHGQPTKSLPRIDADLRAVRASLIVVPGSVAIDLADATIATRDLPRGANLNGHASGHLTIPTPSTSSSALSAKLAFDGTVGGVQAMANASIDGDRIDAVVDVPETSADSVRALAPEAPIDVPVTVHAEVHGPLSGFNVSARVGLGAATLDVSGPIALVPDMHADLTFDAKGVDVSAFTVSGPSTNLGASGEVSVARSKDGAVHGTFAVEEARGTVVANVVPAASLKGEFAIVSGAVSVGVRGTVDETGAPTQVAAELRPSGESFVVDFDVTTIVPNLNAIARIGPIANGRGRVHTKGTLAIGTREIDASVEASADGLALGGERVARVALVAHATGAVSDPFIDATLRGDGVDVLMGAPGSATAKGRHIDTLVATARGHVTAPRVTASVRGRDLPDADASAAMTFGKDTTMRDARLTLSRAGTTVTARADAVQIGPNDVRIDAAEIDGLGAPARVSARMTDGAITVRASAPSLDLGRLAIMLGDDHLKAGTLSLDADLTITQASAKGHIRADATQCALVRGTEGSAHFEATFDGRRVSSTGHADLGSVGHVDWSATSLEIAGNGPIDASSWKNLMGKIEFGSEFDLAKLAAILPPDALPFGELEGGLAIRGEIARDSRTDMTPDLYLNASTTKLAIAGKAPKGTAQEPGQPPIVAKPPWRSAGVDAAVELTIDGDTGATKLAAKLIDVKGPLVTLDASSKDVPFASLLATPRQVVALLEVVPVTAKLAVPARDVGALPEMLASAVASVLTEGTIQGAVSMTGTVLAPTVDLTAKATRVRGDASQLTLALDLDVVGHYDGARATATVKARTRKTEVLDAGADMNVKIADVLAPVDGVPLAWDASVHAKLNQFPLRAIPALGDRQVVGAVSGDVTVDGIHKDARAKVSLAATALTVGDVTFLGATISGAFDGHTLEASARLSQTDGFAEAHARTGARWGADVLPSLDASVPVTASLTAKNFDLASVLPFVDGTFSELAGRVDADARLLVGSDPSSAKLSGTVLLRDGTFELESVGGEFHAATAKVVMTPDGAIRIENASARGTTGMLRATALAHTRGMSLLDAQASVVIPSNESLPIAIGGTQLANVDGTFNMKVNVSNDATKTSLAVDVPVLHVKLPLDAANAVQDLGPMEHVHVGIHHAPDQFVLVPLEAPQEAKTASGKQLDIAVHLGDDVLITRGSDLKVGLTGNPRVTVGARTRVSGQILLTSGALVVQGKPFIIEKGTVTFVGNDPSNPQVVVTARWGAPDGTQIYADYVGPLKTGKVTLRSEPARPTNEILSELLFGTPDGQSASSTAQSQQDSSNVTTGIGVAGGAAAAPLNRALGVLGAGGVISTNVDTSSAGNPRPEVEVQIARDISLQFAVVLGLPPPTNPDHTLVSLDWRFLQNWSVETTVGDAGTSILDFIWQHRY